MYISKCTTSTSRTPLIIMKLEMDPKYRENIQNMDITEKKTQLAI